MSFALSSLLNPLPAIAQNQCLAEALRIFDNYEGAGAVVVLAGELPIGLILRRLIADVIALPCYRQTLGRENCLCFVSVAPVVIAHDATTSALVQVLASQPVNAPPDPFVVTARGRYAGVVARDRLAAALCDADPTAAIWHAGHHNWRRSMCL